MNQAKHLTTQEDTICNFIVRALVMKKHTFHFENTLLPKIYDVLSLRKGFRHRIVIPPTKGVMQSAFDDTQLEYVIILYFKGIENLRSWQFSDDRLQWLDEARACGISFKLFIDDFSQTESNSNDSHINISTEPTRLVLQNTVHIPRQHPLPPPKWKLFIVIDFGALAAVLCTLFAGASHRMRELDFPKGAITFLTLCHVVAILIYGVTPTILSISWIGSWIRAPRPPLESMHPLQRILDQGFEIFTAPAKEGIPVEIRSRFEKLEGHVERLRRVNHELHLQQDELIHLLEDVYPPPPTASHFPSKETPGERPGSPRIKSRAASLDSTGDARAVHPTVSSPSPELKFEGDVDAVHIDISRNDDYDNPQKSLTDVNNTTTLLQVQTTFSSNERLASESPESGSPPSGTPQHPHSHHSHRLLRATSLSTSSLTRGVHHSNSEWLLFEQQRTGEEGKVEVKDRVRVIAEEYLHKRTSLRRNSEDGSDLEGVMLVSIDGMRDVDSPRGDTSAIATSGESSHGDPLAAAAAPRSDASRGSRSGSLPAHHVSLQSSLQSLHLLPAPFRRPSRTADPEQADQEAAHQYQLKKDLKDTSNNGSMYLKTDTSPPAELPLTMVVSHYVKWERELDFMVWTEKMTALMSEHKGFLGLVSIPPEKEGEPFVNTVTFENYQDLQIFLANPEREELLRELEGMLEGTTTAQISEERVMHDAFSELFVHTGECAPPRPPPMWKTCVLTTLSLQMIAWPFNLFLVPWLEEDGVDKYVATALITSLNVVTSMYIGVPLLHMLFGSWLRLPRPREIPQPWKTFDSGFTPNQRLVVIFLYFAPLIVVGILGGDQHKAQQIDAF